MAWKLHPGPVVIFVLGEPPVAGEPGVVAVDVDRDLVQVPARFLTAVVVADFDALDPADVAETESEAIGLAALEVVSGVVRCE